MKIVSPSYMRAGKVAVNELKVPVVLAVPECQIKDYKETYKDNEFWTVPDKCVGSMARTRNFLRSKCKDKWLLMIDDDVFRIAYHENEKVDYIEGNQLLDFLENHFEMTEQVGTVFWGLNLQMDPKFYRLYSPFSFLAPVLGPFCGHVLIGDGLRYDERLESKEDYDFFIQVIWRYKRVLRNNKHFYKTKHITQEGGISTWRSMKKEKEQAALLVKKWGSKIVKYDFKKSINPIVKIPISGI